jgi:hypothetical protein
MKRSKLQDTTVDQLVERFSGIGVEQDQAILRRRHARFNHLFGEMGTTFELCHDVLPVGFARAFVRTQTTGITACCR